MKFLARVVALFWAILPPTLRGYLLKVHFFIEGSTPGNSGVKVLLQAERDYMAAVNYGVMRVEGGVHPKHRVMNYHEFFIRNIDEGSTVVDIGCGYGAVANSIVHAKNVKVYGIDIIKENIDQANKLWKHERLKFMAGDALEVFPTDKCDAVVLSNVLEHIDKRVEFLKKLQQVLKPRKILIRVPVFERDWTVGYMKELGLAYFSDDTHFVEHTQEGWVAEIESSGLKVISKELRWGEIWCECICDRS